MQLCDIFFPQHHLIRKRFLFPLDGATPLSRLVMVHWIIWSEFVFLFLYWLKVTLWWWIVCDNIWRGALWKLTLKHAFCFHLSLSLSVVPCLWLSRCLDHYRDPALKHNDGLLNNRTWPRFFFFKVDQPVPVPVRGPYARSLSVRREKRGRVGHSWRF